MFCSLIEKVSDLNDMIIEGNMTDALEKYYDTDVEIQENDLAPVCGLNMYRQKVAQFYEAVTDWRSAQPVHVAFGEGVTMVEWFQEYSHRELGEKKVMFVAIQEWTQGKNYQRKNLL